MAGESLAGILESGFRIITKVTVESERVGALIFFGLSLLFICTCFICHRFIKGHDLVLYYVDKCSRSVEGDQLDTDEEIEISHIHRQGDEQPLLVSGREENTEKNGTTNHNGGVHDKKGNLTEVEFNAVEKTSERKAGGGSEAPRHTIVEGGPLARKIAAIVSMIRQRGLAYSKFFVFFII